MRGDVEAHAAEDVDGLGGGAGAGHGVAAGADDGNSFVVKMLDVDLEFLGEVITSDGLGHGGAAGVAAADEEDGGFEQAIDNALIIHALADDLVGIFLDSQEGGRLGESCLAGVKNNFDIVEQFGGPVRRARASGGRGGQSDGGFDAGDDVLKNAVVGAAHGDGVVVVEIRFGGAQFVGNLKAAVGVHLKDQADRAGPELTDHALGKIVEGAEVLGRILGMSQVDGIGARGGGFSKLGERGAGLGMCEEAGDAVDGLSRKDQEASGGEGVDAALDLRHVIGGLKNLENLSLHRRHEQLSRRFKQGVKRGGL